MLANPISFLGLREMNSVWNLSLPSGWNSQRGRYRLVLVSDMNLHEISAIYFFVFLHITTVFLGFVFLLPYNYSARAKI